MPCFFFVVLSSVFGCFSGVVCCCCSCCFCLFLLFNYCCCCLFRFDVAEHGYTSKIVVVLMLVHLDFVEFVLVVSMN